ncbi:MAG: acyl-CoA desaturase [Chloroflexi bacterium]|nr:acyl-CoA desaturase [Chloroflexota bacterium]
MTTEIKDSSAITQRPPGSEYAELKRLIKQQGLMNKQPLYYTFKITLTLAMLGLSIALVALIDTLWLQLLNAVFMGFIFTQMGFMGHDAGHRQIFSSTRKNDIVGLTVNLLLGVSRSWWVIQHNEHHNNPNDLDLDPHIAIPIMVFSEEQARNLKGIMRFFIRYQAFYFFPILLGEGIGMRVAGAQYMISRKIRFPIAEPLLMALHFILYFGMLFYFLSGWHAFMFFIVHQMVFGLYMGSIFAPNHKGMPTVTRDSGLDFLRRQVITARNMRAHPVTDFMYGGLNYQIEHHLFPTIPRNRLKEAQKIVRTFCNEHSISYHEVGAFRSQWEILDALHKFSAPLRKKTA